MSLPFAFTQEGIFKKGEKRLKRIGDPASPRALHRGSLPPGLKDGLELAFACRGIGWDFGKDVYVAPRTTSTERIQFLADATIEFVKHLLAFDLCDSLIKLVPGVGALEGGSIFLPDLPLHLRYGLSTAIHILEGYMIDFAIEACNDFLSLLAVGLFNRAPESWRPLYGYPWRATSLHEFWGKSWHQVLRQLFLSFGGYPGLWLGGKVGLVLGVFFASGLFHALFLQLPDYRVVLFLELQGVGVLLENAYRRYTGWRVEGVAGWCWTALWVVILGQMCSASPLSLGFRVLDCTDVFSTVADAWSIGGFAGAVILPEELSVVRRLVFKFPVVRYFARWVVSWIMP